MEESSIFDFNLLQYLSLNHIMADVAHLVRASGCGSEGRGFDPLHSPQNNKMTTIVVILLFKMFGGLSTLLVEGENCQWQFARQRHK
jgi:hypothetical protein